jgi:hypothetical protein
MSKSVGTVIRIVRNTMHDYKILVDQRSFQYASWEEGRRTGDVPSPQE